MRTLVAALVWMHFFAVAALAICIAHAVEMPLPAATEDSSPAALQQAAAVAQRLAVRLSDAKDADEMISPIERPLLLFGDDPRNLTRGILWGWGTGRPVAVAELWRGRAEGSPHAVSLTLTGSAHVNLTADGAAKWQPAETQVEFIPLPESPPVAAREAARLRQIKEISRRFTAHEFWDPENSRFELRLLVQPVHRYQDTEADIQDGALFVLAHGTNPEALLFIEAAGTTVEKARWQFGLVRSSNAELHAELDGKEVWTEPRVKGGSTRPAHPYFVFSLPPANHPPAPEPSAPASEKTRGE
jgi:hypothetical protein